MQVCGHYKTQSPMRVYKCLASDELHCFAMVLAAFIAGACLLRRTAPDDVTTRPNPTLLATEPRVEHTQSECEKKGQALIYIQQLLTLPTNSKKEYRHGSGAWHIRRAVGRRAAGGMGSVLPERGKPGAAVCMAHDSEGGWMMCRMYVGAALPPAPDCRMSDVQDNVMAAWVPVLDLTPVGRGRTAAARRARSDTMGSAPVCELKGRNSRWQAGGWGRRKWLSLPKSACDSQALPEILSATKRSRDSSDVMSQCNVTSPKLPDQDEFCQLNFCHE